MSKIKQWIRHRVDKKKLSVALVVSVIGFSGAISSVAGASEKPKDLANITLGVPTFNIPVLPIWVGQRYGYFADHGINAKVVMLSSTALTTAVVSGSVQFINDSSSQFLLSRTTGVPIEAVSEYDNGEPNALILSNSFSSAHHITAKTPLKTIMKFIPGSVGASSAVSTTGALHVLFRSFGIQDSQTTILTLTTAAAEVSELSKNSIDWFVSAEPTPLQTQQTGNGIIVANPKNASAWNVKYLNQVLVTTASYANTNPGITREVVAAFNESTKYVHLHGQKAVDVAQTNLPGITRGILSKSIQSLQWPMSGKMNANIWRSTIAFNVKAGVVPHGMKVVENVDWTNKYVTH